jgi:hypothetical protein
MTSQLPLSDRTATDLRDHWRAKASAFGWAFASDWDDPAVDAVCDALAAGADVWTAAERLGRDRATAGVSLAEALVDIDALATIVPGRYTDPLRRAVSLGWADRITVPAASVVDPMTGLATTEYLRVRLGEVYRAAEVRAEPVSTSWGLVVARLDLGGHAGWQRTLPMILVADGLRRVFDAGQSLVLMGEAVAAALCERDAVLARRARLLHTMVTDAIERDPQIIVPGPAVWIEKLPSTYTAALALTTELGR